MFEYYRAEKGKIVECDEARASITAAIAPDKEEHALLETRFGLHAHDIESALDPDELGRYEPDGKQINCILKRPRNFTGEDKLLFTVSSMGLFLQPGRLIVVSTEALEIPVRPPHPVLTPKDAFLNLVYGSIAQFLGHLRVINMLSESLEKRIHKSMGNRLLLDMFSLEKSLVYFVSGIASNQMVIEKLKLGAGKARLGVEQVSFLDDIAIENAQCGKQAEIYAEVLSSLMNARSSVVNNNLNELIKRLTIISVVFMPMNLLAGIGGMSEFSSWLGPIPWYIAYPGFILSLVPFGFFTYFILKKSGLEKVDDLLTEKKKARRRLGKGEVEF